MCVKSLPEWAGKAESQPGIVTVVWQKNCRKFKVHRITLNHKFPINVDRWKGNEFQSHLISLPFQPTQASYLHTHRQPSHSMSKKIFLASASFLNVGGFLQSSAYSHLSAARPLQRAAGHIKDAPPLLILVATME